MSARDLSGGEAGRERPRPPEREAAPPERGGEAARASGEGVHGDAAGGARAVAGFPSRGRSLPNAMTLGERMAWPGPSLHVLTSPGQRGEAVAARTIRPGDVILDSGLPAVVVRIRRGAGLYLHCRYTHEPEGSPLWLVGPMHRDSPVRLVKGVQR